MTYYKNILDIYFVSTDGDWPTPENSSDFTERESLGRGSLVFYNQASMFHGPETEFDILNAAKQYGHSGTSNFSETAQKAFTDLVHFFSISEST